MNHLETISVKMNRTFKFGAARLTVLWLGVSLTATGAAATTIHQPIAPTAASANAGTSAKAKPSAAARARARAARIRAARAKASRSAKALAEAKTPRYRTDSTGNLVPDIRAAAAIIYDPATGK